MNHHNSPGKAAFPHLAPFRNHPMDTNLCLRTVQKLHGRLLQLPLCLMENLLSLKLIHVVGGRSLHFQLHLSPDGWRSPAEARGGHEWNRTYSGITTPEDVSLSSEDNTGDRRSRKPQFPLKHLSMRNRHKRRSGSSSSDDPETDMYQPPQRASANHGSLSPGQNPPPTPLSTYGEFYYSFQVRSRTNTFLNHTTIIRSIPNGPPSLVLRS